MFARTMTGAALGASIAFAAAAFGLAVPAAAQITVSEADEVRAGELAVPVNKSQVLRSDRPFAKALIGNPDIADVLPLSDRSIYVLGKKMGTTSLTLYDRSNSLIAVVDIAVGPDVIGLKRQLSELMPTTRSAPAFPMTRLSWKASSAAARTRTRRSRSPKSYARARSSTSCRSALRSRSCSRSASPKSSAARSRISGFSSFVSGSGDNGFQGAIGGGASLTGSLGNDNHLDRSDHRQHHDHRHAQSAAAFAGRDRRQLWYPPAVFHIGGLNFDAPSTRWSARASSRPWPNRP